MANEVWLIFILVPFWWCFVTTVIAHTSGWQALARHYQLKSHEDGLHWQGSKSGIFRYAMGYNRCLWIATSTKGLYLRTGPWLFFRTGHPPLFIPWEAFNSIQEEKFLWIKMLKFQLKEPSITFRLDKNAIDSIKVGLLK